MTFLETIDCEKWCKDRGIDVFGSQLLSFTPPDQFYGIKVKIPSYVRDRLSIAYTLLAPIEEENGESLLWFRRWNIWSESSEHYAMKIWQALRTVNGEKRMFQETPGHVFSKANFIDLQAFFSIPILFRWDAYLVPSHGEHFVFLSHDEVIYVISKTFQIHEKLLEYLKYWSPETGVPFYLQDSTNKPK